MERKLGLTESEIMYKLGLDSWDKFFRDRSDMTNEMSRLYSGTYEAQYELYGRRTGRTTKMLMAALHAMSAGNDVFIVSATHESAKLIMRQLEVYAQKLRIDNLVTGSSSIATLEATGPKPGMFYDHTCREPLHIPEKKPRNEIPAEAVAFMSKLGQKRPSDRSVEKLVYVMTRNPYLLELGVLGEYDGTLIHFKSPEGPQVKGANPHDIILDHDTVDCDEVSEWKAIKPYCVRAPEPEQWIWAEEQ